MTWKNPLRNLPSRGERVWVLLYHWKNRQAMSCEIYAGEVEAMMHAEVDAEGEGYTSEERVYVENCDDYGQGSSRWEFRDANSPEDCNKIAAWCYAYELKLPEWLP